MTTIEKEEEEKTMANKASSSLLQFGEDSREAEKHEQVIDESEIIECIDSCLNYLGRSVAYTVYLNWSAVDRKRRLGILGDPRSFRTSIYGLFGNEQGSLIEAFLVKKLKERFPVLESLLALNEKESDFVTVINRLKQCAKN